MVEIEKKDYEAVVDEIISTKDLRLIIDNSLKNQNYYRSIILDISKGVKSKNYKIIQQISKSKKISAGFIVDQAKSVVSFFESGKDSSKDDYYNILECTQDSSEDDIRTSWIRLMKIYHPDKIGKSGLDKSKKINEAYNILINPQSREMYDRSYFLNVLPVTVKNDNIGRSNYTSVLTVFICLLLIFSTVFLVIRYIDSKDDSKYSAGINNYNVDQADIRKSDKAVGNIDSQSDNSIDNIFDTEEQLEVFKEVEENNNDNIKNTENVTESNKYEVKPEIAAGNNMYTDLRKNPRQSVNTQDIASVIQTHSSEKDIESPMILEAEKDDEFYKNTEQNNYENMNKLWSDSDKIDIVFKDKEKMHTKKNSDSKALDNMELSKINTEKSKEPVINVSTQNTANNKTGVAVHIKEKGQAHNIVREDKVKKARTSKEFSSENVRLTEMKSAPMPDKSSIYLTISDYIFAYKNRDFNKLSSLFDMDAKENGVSINEVFKIYKKNFEVLDIVAYDIKFRRVNLNNNEATVDGDFIISYNSRKDDVFKKSYGDINWKLTWNDNSWLINEIIYKVTSTKVGDEFAR